MIRHFLSSSLAALLRAPMATLTSVLTLALGLACFIAAYGIGSYWRSGDSYHAQAGRTFVVGQSFSRAGEAQAPPFSEASSFTIGKYLREDVPELVRLARVDHKSEVTLLVGQSKLLFDVIYAENDFAQIFDFDYVRGSSRDALNRNRVILTEDAAMRLFGSTPAIGQSLLIGDRSAIVGAVIKAVRQPSFMGDTPSASLRFSIIAPWAIGPDANNDAQDLWTGTDGLTFAVAPSGMSASKLDAQLSNLLKRRTPDEIKAAWRILLMAIPIKQLTIRRLDASLFAQSGTSISSIVALVGLGALVLVISCVNYVNLATAQAALRAKEIGMRKVVGAHWTQIAAQTWLEALGLTAAAGVLALVLLVAATPLLRTVADVDPLYFLSTGLSAWGFVLGLIGGVALLAGAYPALVLSRVPAADALRSGRIKGGSDLIARVLVGVQFASASFLIILVTVTQLQRVHLTDTALGKLGDPVLVLNDLRETGVDPQTLETTLAQQTGVLDVALVSRAPWGTGSDQVNLARTLQAAAAAPTAYLKRVDYEYFDVLSLKLIAGRTFDRARETEASPLIAGGASSAPPPIIIDERYAARLGFATPQAAVGRTIYVPEDFMKSFGLSARPAEIIGVTQTERTRLNASDVDGHVYEFSPAGRFPIVRLSGSQQEAAIRAIRKTWDQLAPHVALDLSYYDDLFAQSFAAYDKIGALFLFLSGAAFLIASVGLVGIALHIALRRRFEIAVRKTLGSSVSRIIRLLLLNFSIPVLIGNVLAWPISYVAAATYLSGFADRIDLNLMPFAFSIAVTLLIAWGAVLGVVLKAASARPADVLRHA